MLRYRFISGTALVAALLAIAWLDQWLGGRTFGDSTIRPGLVLYVVALVATALGAGELAGVIRAKQIACSTPLAMFAAVTGLTLVWVGPLAGDRAVPLMASAPAAVLAVSLFVYSRGRNTQGVMAAGAATLMIMIYPGAMLGMLLSFRNDHSVWWILGLIAVTKTCDTGAYFTGRSIGRHKLIPWLSPGKTWEGLAGGVISSAVVGGLLAWASVTWLTEPDRLPIWIGAAAGALFGVTGQLGDLWMSLFKRDAGIKDSSTILPGLGGILDVLDSILLVAPVAWWVLAWQSA